MTREEFMQDADHELNDTLRKVRNRMMNLIERAYAEGQKNAGADQVLEVVREALSRMQKPETTETASAEPEKCSCWHAIPTGLKREEGTFEYRCRGTPERDICTCGGDKSRCNFYGG